MKRAFDIVASGCAIVVLLVPSAALSVAIYIKSPGASPIYTQKRVGRIAPDGSYKTFNMHKFRSMVPGAEGMLMELQYLNEADAPLFKIQDDVRIIPGLGGFIRRHSIDELPQLIDVFVGHMSLIGPRPPLPSEVVAYEDEAIDRLTIKPGAGGVWQASPEHQGSFEKMVEMDKRYIENRSLGYDLKLMFKTVRTMLLGGGR